MQTKIDEAMDLKAWQQTMQPRIDEAMVWKRDFGPLLADLVAHQLDSALALTPPVEHFGFFSSCAWEKIQKRPRT